MVLSLERVRQHEDRNLLSAHIMVLLEKDYTQAQVRASLAGLLVHDTRWGKAAACAVSCANGPRVLVL